MGPFGRVAVAHDNRRAVICLLLPGIESWRAIRTGCVRATSRSRARVRAVELRSWLTDSLLILLEQVAADRVVGRGDLGGHRLLVDRHAAELDADVAAGDFDRGVFRMTEQRRWAIDRVLAERQAD